MKLKPAIRVFPRKNKWTPDDELVFIGEPPIIGKPPDYPVYVSCTFTWDMQESERLYRAWKQDYTDVKLGGPAFGDVGNDFTPGMFIKRDVVFTSRGCPKDCPWCFVHEREGGIKEIPVTDGHIIQDNNLLACSDRHLENVFEMLARQKHGAVFQGGLDVELLTPFHVKLLSSIKVDRMFFAYDHLGSTYHIEKAADMLSDYNRDKKRCYVLCGFYPEDTPVKAEKRMLKVWDLGYMPFSMFYRNGDISRTRLSKDWQDMTRIFSRPAIMRGYCKKHEKESEKQAPRSRKSE